MSIPAILASSEMSLTLMLQNDEVIELSRSQTAASEGRIERLARIPVASKPPSKTWQTPSWVTPLQTAVLKILKVFGVQEQKEFPEDRP